MKIYQYAVLLHPTEDEKKAGKTSEILAPVTSVVAANEQGALVQAARAIPETALAHLDRVEVFLRPF